MLPPIVLELPSNSSHFLYFTPLQQLQVSLIFLLILVAPVDESSMSITTSCNTDLDPLAYIFFFFKQVMKDATFILILFTNRA